MKSLLVTQVILALLEDILGVKEYGGGGVVFLKSCSWCCQ